MPAVNMLRSPLSSPLHPVEAAARRSRPASRHFPKPWLSSIAMPPPISLFHISWILVVLAACSALLHTTTSTTSSGSSSRSKAVTTTTTFTPGTQGAQCVSQTLPNPIAAQFPNNATGVLNATLLIVPIPLEQARRLIPAQYGILERAYRAVLPADFPAGMYPLLVQAAHDHDVQLKAYGITLDDFSRIGLEFPFVDLLGDGHSSFRWAPAQLITADHEIALGGSADYGTVVTPADFRPACNAYERLSGPGGGGTGFKAQAVGRDGAGAHTEIEVRVVSRTEEEGGKGEGGDENRRTGGYYPIEVFRNITNQPTFANGSSCDNMVRLFNSSMSTGEKYGPVFVRGSVRAVNVQPLDEEGEVEWTDVYGVQVATPFIENNYLDCAAMRGYTGTGGDGDSDFLLGWEADDVRNGDRGDVEL